MINQPQPRSFREKVALGLFWSWNLIFLAFLTLGFAPRILPELIIAVRTSVIPTQFLFYALVLSLVPLSAVILGLTGLRRHPGRLLAFGYVVEGPLMLMLVVRFFLIRQATPGVVIVMAIAALGMAAFLWRMLDPRVERRSRSLGWMQLAGLTLMLLTALYASIWISFYALPIAVEGLIRLYGILVDLPRFFRDITNILRDLFTGNLLWLPFSLLGFLLLIYTATLFVLTPLAVPLLSLRAWLQSWRSMRGRWGWKSTAGLVVGTVLVTGILFTAANRQPQSQAFQLLREPPATSEQAAALLKQEQAIRSGLLNAYLSPFRYISAMGEVVHIREIYQHTFKLDPEKAFAVQRMYESVASPLLYKPVLANGNGFWRDNRALVDEPLEAARLYQAFFDQPIADAERNTIVRAVRSTWSFEQANAAWQAVDDREVYLQRQEINLNEHGDWADVEVFEVYQNQTANLQEVIYYFNLPESAAMTGVWLGESPDRTKRFEFQVAPRGAAQEVYRNEIVRGIDPALLEQIGPRQYRLRIFPIPPVRMGRDESGVFRSMEEAPPMYLWFSYRTMAVDNAWPLPRLAEKRNIFWDSQTVRLVNEASISPDGDGWMPESLEASEIITHQIHQFDFPEGLSVLAVPIEQAELPVLPKDLRLAVVLDRSRSMKAYAAEVQAALSRLNQVATRGSEIYLTSSQFRGEEPEIVQLGELTASDVLYFGGQNPAELLEQFSHLSSGREYDAVIVLTDGSPYELGLGKFNLPVPSAPVWMVHLSSAIPLGYDDGTLEAIQASGGGMVVDVEVALQRLAVDLERRSGSELKAAMVQDVLDGYVWTVLPSEQISTIQPAADGMPQAIDSPGFKAIAARRLILAEMQRYQRDIRELDTLDSIHNLAKEHNIVTPYSSMIVLVNFEQRQMLERLEQMDDRFEREYEGVGNTLPPVQGPLSGVPEPHEWLLLGLAAVFLLYYMRSKHLILKPGRIR
jgi:putative PEP-CTERM system integral membrane protein